MALPWAGAMNMPSALPEPVMGRAGVASALFLIRTNASMPTRLLEMPRICQGDHDDANHDPVDEKHPQSVGLQVANEPGDSGVTHDRGNSNADHKRRLHPGRQALLVNLVCLQQRGASDERSREQKAEANRGFPGQVSEQSCGDG